MTRPIVRVDRWLLLAGLTGAAAVQAASPDAAADMVWSQPTAAVVPAVRLFSPQLGAVRTSTATGEQQALVEVRVILQSRQAEGGPIGLSTLRLVAGASPGAGVTPLAVGSWSQGCNYLDLGEIGDGLSATVALASGASFTVGRTRDGGPNFSFRSGGLALCLVYELPRSALADALTLHAGKTSLPVPMTAERAQAAQRSPPSPDDAPTAAQAVALKALVESRPAVVGGAVALALAVLLFLARGRLRAGWRSLTSGMREVDEGDR